MGFTLTGDQHKTADKRISEILRQLGQAEYPYDPERLNAALQALVDGRFEAVGGQFPSVVLAGDLIPSGYTVIEDVAPTDFAVESLEFVGLLEKGEEYVGGEEMRKRAVTLRGNLGLCDAKRILTEQQKLSESLRGKYIVLPGTVLRDSDGDLDVPYLCWDGDRWVLNFNWLRNDFNDRDRLVRVVSYSLRSPSIYIGGVSFFSDANQPPIIFPISAKGVESVVYFWLSNPFNSHKTFKKNFSTSSLILNFWIAPYFSARAVYPANRANSKQAENRSSIFVPKV